MTPHEKRMQGIRGALAEHDAHKREVLLAALSRRLNRKVQLADLPSLVKRILRIESPESTAIRLDGIPLVEFAHGKFENVIVDGVETIKFVAQYKDHTLL